MYQGYVAGICPRDVLPGNVPGISYIFKQVPGKCCRDMFHGYDTGTRLRGLLQRL